MNALTLVAALDAAVPLAISVDIDELYDNGVPAIRSTDLDELAMVVRLDKEVGNSPTGPLDLQQVDFVGPADVVKRLFTLPYQDGQPLFAVHKMGNTLLLDSVIVADTNSAMLGSGIGNHVITGNNQDMIGGDVSRHLPALDLHEMRSTISSDVSIYTPSSSQRNHNNHDVASDSTTLAAAASDSIDAAVTTTAAGKEFSSSPFVPPPNYFMPSVPAPSKQLLSWDLHEMKLALSSDVSIYHADEHPAFTVKTLDTTEAIELSTCLDFYLDNVMANVPELALALHTKGFIRGMKILRTDEIPFLNPLEFIESATSSSGSTNAGTEGLHAHTTASSSSSSSLRRNHRALQHDRMAMALSYNDEELTCRTQTEYHLDSFDSTSGHTQQDKGQGPLEVNKTVTTTTTTTNNPTDHQHHSSSGIQNDHLRNSNPSTNDTNHHQQHQQQQQQRQPPIFDPKVIDIDATTILRFLKENCRQDDGTYILRRSPDGQNLRLYDLGLASSSKQKHFKWMLGDSPMPYQLTYTFYTTTANIYTRYIAMS